ncbi:hypothetical protein DENIS_0769 [Desulfonema ishimotonii]|uniref:Pilus assembly protein PilM n=1 Tax=Desulfonema ishimotonii TaxID=45657 RepID=A0A401FS93_9BACT|nr:hypothetical protein [Desulfonema ishimotonii]GBC59828.1 hypothetical protein DENIS_0769 [Desulfonema ishimotonii]
MTGRHTAFLGHGLGSRLRKMIRFQWQRPVTGVEITGTSVKIARLEKIGTGWALSALGSAPVPPGALNLAYGKPNIPDTEPVKAAIRAAMAQVGGTIPRAGLSLPGEVVKVVVREFEALPKTGAEVGRMLRWWAEKTFRIPGPALSVSYHHIGKTQNGLIRLLITLGFREVIREYEDLLSALKIDAEVVRPASVNQFNFYSSAMPDSGTVAWLGFSEKAFSFLVAEAGQILFFSGVRTGPGDPAFIRDLDMTLQHYAESCPDRKIEALCMPYPDNYWHLAEELPRIITSEVILLDETRLITLPDPAGEDLPARHLAAYSAAMGAAISLAQ